MYNCSSNGFSSDLADGQQIFTVLRLQSFLWILSRILSYAVSEKVCLSQIWLCGRQTDIWNWMRKRLRGGGGNKNKEKEKDGKPPHRNVGRYAVNAAWIDRQCKEILERKWKKTMPRNNALCLCWKSCLFQSTLQTAFLLQAVKQKVTVAGWALTVLPAPELEQ